jgi:hypothetical protein
VLGLANNGSMYCVPTSAMNMLLYAANHGFPAMDPGPGNYQSQSKYTLATLNIAFLGVDMQTSPTDGTYGGPAFDGLKDWIQSSGLAGQMSVDHLYLNNNYTPTFKKMSLKALNGNLVSFAYGRYDVIGSYFGLPLLDRTGGHMVTLSKAAISGSNRVLWCRDPADSSADCVQSTFMSRQILVTEVAIAYCASPICLRPMSALNHPADDGRYRLIDSYLTIKPKAGYSFSNTGNLIIMKIPHTFFGTPTVDLQLLVDFPGIQDLVIDPDESGFYFIPVGTDSLLHVDAMTEEMTEVAPLGSPRRLTLGRKLEIYVLEDDQIICINPVAEEPVTAVEPLPGPVAAMTYLNSNDQVRLLASEEHMFYDYRIGLPAGVPPTMIPVPDEIPLGMQASMAENPADGSLWIVSDASDSIWGITKPVAAGPGSVVEVVVPGVAGPTAVSFDDAGRMFVTAGGEVHEMIQPPGAAWMPAPDPQFPDTPAGDRFIATCSRTNYDPAEHSGPAWNNIDPDDLDQTGETMPDCLADLDGDGLTGIADLLILLAAWGDVNGFEPADFDPLGGDGIVGITDMLELLAAWGPCP